MILLYKRLLICLLNSIFFVFIKNVITYINGNLKVKSTYEESLELFCYLLIYIVYKSTDLRYVLKIKNN